ncbi:TonB-linked outer membrane protein, SusC/RagA family [Arenibacter nanhaiticus]|uniref:TonB-linked outer membrane protein, SusC/RagA family n=1 Tax=Arenibacter nanhaiticus TaxID=558155 RepID=A0A1M6M9E6_9FLAO|nr:TonB-dependent receptor [Arenibacter nanhaiticus]SHJ80075.1 TonB-linked outer membrane protein, SusC/RagA family [Arenibacter nanhaiticus]
MNERLRKRTTFHFKGLCKLRVLFIGLLSFYFGFPNMEDKSFVNDTFPLEQEMLKVQGRVYDSNEPPEALAFVSVSLKGSNKGVITDENGYFDIVVQKGDILVFSFTGFSPKEFNVQRAYSDLVISLEEEVGMLDEVVITGYGEERKLNMISSISTLDVAKNVANKPITSLSQALQGGITGLTVTQNSGLPGGDAASIKIRGISTLGYSDPLVLVDGIPMDMNDLDPNTIESVTVLKDASAAAIYGARAANGVIVIKTKRGKTGQVSVSYNSYVGIQNATYLPDFMDGASYMEMVNTAYINNGGNPVYNQEEINITRNKSDIYNYPNTNWLDETWNKNALLTNHSVGVQGGNNIARFALTVNYLDQEGFIENVGFDRFNIRANTTVNLTDNVTVNMDFNAIRKDQMETNLRDGETDYVLNYIYRAPPTLVPKYPSKDGVDFYGIFFEMRNPKAMLERGGTTQRLTDNMSINIQPKWEVLPKLNLNAQYSYRINSNATNQKRDPFNFFEYETGVLNYTWDNVRSASTGRSSYYFIGGNIDYTYLNEKHRLFVLGGYNQELTNSGNWDQWAMRSYFGKANYTFNDKYLAEVTFRADGSSRFGKGNKTGYFPSFGLGWNMHEEEFLNQYNWLDNLKVRLSYGQLGNENIGLYQYQNLISAGNGVETIFGNPNITWETVNMLNYGFDLAIFKGVNFNFDIYDKLTKDIILSPPISLIGGTSSANINAGKVRNQGFELGVNYSRNFNDGYFTIHGGLSKNKNKIEKLPGGPYINGSSIHKEGYALGSHYRYLTNGLLQESDFTTDGAGNIVPKDGVVLWGDQRPGDIRFVDINEDGNFDNSDRVITGDGQPDFNYFTNFSTGYQNWDFELLLQGVQGVNASYGGANAIPLNLNGDTGSTPQKFHSDYWTPDTPDAYYPRPTPEPGNNLQPSNYWDFDASYLRVKYIQIGYTLNEKFLNPIGIKKCRVYANAQNPFTLTSQSITDPENLGGSSTYPLIKVLTLGVNVKF